MYNFVKPFIFKLSPEKAHALTIKALKSGMFPSCILPNVGEDPCLKTELLGLEFSNPIGLAAGFDKNAEAISGLLGMGFGFVEVGTVTPKPQIGNPSPRIFRHAETGSVINRMGFPNEGLTVFKANIQKFCAKNPHVKTPIGLNIGMNKDQTEPEEDYKALIKDLGPYADYITVNVSSPNTPGLRNLQNPEFLKPFLKTLIKEKKNLSNNPPLLIKLAPDLNEVEIQAISKVLLDVKIDGIILTNTTLDRPDLLPSEFSKEKGGLSGALLKDKSTQVISAFYKETQGNIPIIGVGGVSTAEDVIEKIKAGASLIQLYTGLIYHGPQLPSILCKNIAKILKANDCKSLSDLVGDDHKTSQEKSKRYQG